MREEINASSLMISPSNERLLKRTCSLMHEQETRKKKEWKDGMMRNSKMSSDESMARRKSPIKLISSASTFSKLSKMENMVGFGNVRMAVTSPDRIYLLKQVINASTSMLFLRDMC